jgi:alpha-tubulin suppressor-like RCC1 family protein
MKKLTLTMTFIVFLFTATLAQSNAILNKTIQVSNGAHHSLILKEDGTVWAFGSNAYGQLCDGTTTNRNRPVQVSGLSDIIMVAAGGGQSFALREDGTVWACGGNSSGELGDGTITHRSRPVKSKLSDIIKIAAGGAHGLALKDDGTVLSWGYNKFGQLGIGSTTKSINPVQVPGVSNITDIVAENCHSLALRNDGIVIGWGLNGPGQLGDGTSRDQRSPIQIPGISNITLIEAGTNYSLFLKDDGTVWGAGGSNYPDYIIQLTELSNISYLTTKYSHIIAQKNDGTMWAWGPNNTGQLGDGTTIDQDSPIHVPELEQFTTIDAGYCSNLALKEDGAVWSWGCNGTGQLGYADASILPKPIPSDIQFSAKSYTATQNTSLTVTIISTAQKDIAVSYTTVDGTAIAGIDYVYTSGSLSFLAAETQKVITLTILNNPSSYINKTFGLRIDVPSNVFLNDASEVSITISGNLQDLSLPFDEIITLYDNAISFPSDALYKFQKQEIIFTQLDDNNKVHCVLEHEYKYYQNTAIDNFEDTLTYENNKYYITYEPFSKQISTPVLVCDKEYSVLDMTLVGNQPFLLVEKSNYEQLYYQYKFKTSFSSPQGFENINHPYVSSIVRLDTDENGEIPFPGKYVYLDFYLWQTETFGSGRDTIWRRYYVNGEFSEEESITIQNNAGKVCSMLFLDQATDGHVIYFIDDTGSKLVKFDTEQKIINAYPLPFTLSNHREDLYKVSLTALNSNVFIFALGKIYSFDGTNVSEKNDIQYTINNETVNYAQNDNWNSVDIIKSVKTENSVYLIIDGSLFGVAKPGLTRNQEILKFSPSDFTFTKHIIDTQENIYQIESKEYGIVSPENYDLVYIGNNKVLISSCTDDQESSDLHIYVSFLQLLDIETGQVDYLGELPIKSTDIISLDHVNNSYVFAIAKNAETNQTESYRFSIINLYNQTNDIDEENAQFLTLDNNLYITWGHGNPYSGTWNYENNCLNNVAYRQNKAIQIYPSVSQIVDLSDNYIDGELNVYNNYISSPKTCDVYLWDSTTGYSQKKMDFEDASVSYFSLVAYQSPYIAVFQEYINSERKITLVKNDLLATDMFNMSFSQNLAALFEDKAIFIGNSHTPSNQIILTKYRYATKELNSIVLTDTGNDAIEPTPDQIDINKNEYIAITWDNYLTLGNAVTNINHEPVFLGTDSFDFYENLPTNSTVGQISVSDSEADSCTIIIVDSSCAEKFSLITDPQIDNQYTITIISNEETDYEATDQYTLCILADDGYHKSQKTFYINILNVPESPLIKTLPNLIGDENQPITMIVDIADPDGDPLTLEIISSTTDIISNDSISISGLSNRFTFIQLNNYEQTLPVTITPNDSQHGEALLLIRVTDKDGLSVSRSITVTVLRGYGDPPVANDQNITVHEDEKVYIQLKASDPENDILSFHLLNLPTHGTVHQTNNLFLYTPNSDYNGPDIFTFKANDGHFDSNSATVLITVYPVYDTPQADLQHVTTTENMPVNITLTGFSPDNKPLTYHITNPPAHGSLSQSLPYLTYTPDYHFYGTDEFTYIANDGISDSLPASVSLTVARSNTYVLNFLGNGYGTFKVNSSSYLLPQTISFQTDQEVCFEALPDSDWRFINWTGDIQSTENPSCIIMDQNMTITANMEIKTFVLSIDGSEPITINNALHSLPFSKAYEIHSHITLESTSVFFNCWESDLQIFDNPYTFSINSDMAITASFFPVPDWQSDIHVERLVNTSDVVTHDSVIIGAASQAYSKSASDPPDNYSCHIVLNNQSFDAMEKEIKKDNHSEYQWIIAVDPHGNADSSYVQTTATISWNPDTFSSEGHFLLKSMTNEILVPDMRQTTEFQFTDNSYVLFKIIWQRLETFEFHLQQGWNLISLPMTPSNTALSHLFPDYEAAYAYQNGAYYPVTNILPGKGYWLKIPSQKIYSISGQPFPSYTIDFSNGWHLIGGAYNEMSPDDESIKVIFQYINGVYKQAFTLLPGFGYWIKIEE